MKLRIGHRRYSAEPLTPALLKEVDRADRESLGLCFARKGVIAVDATLTPDDQAETLLHEVIHAAWDAYGFPLEGLDEEMVANLTAKALCQVIRDNPALIGALQAGLDGAAIFNV